MQLTVREAQPPEFDQLLKIQQLAIERLSSTHYSEQQIAAIVTSQRRVRFHHEQLLLAELNHKIVGFATLVDAGWIFWRPMGTIGGVYVHPDFVRQGVATQLIAALEEIAIAKRYRQITVLSSLNAVPFYQAQGYETLGPANMLCDFQTQIPCMYLQKLYPKPEAPQRQVFMANLQWALVLLPLLLIML